MYHNVIPESPSQHYTGQEPSYGTGGLRCEIRKVETQDSRRTEALADRDDGKDPDGETEAEFIDLAGKS